MDSILKSQLSGKDGHPTEDELLLFVDGELPASSIARVRAHLEACWSCRVRTEKIEETISTFVDYRNCVLRRAVDPPPHNWGNFSSNLTRLAARVGRPSLLANVRSTLGRLFTVSDPFRSISHRLSFLTHPTFLLRAVSVIVVLSVIASLFVYFNQTTTVTASELLRNAKRAEVARTKMFDQPVVYQKLQLRSRSRGQDRIAGLEIWNDTNRSRARQSVTDDNGQRFLPVSDGSQESKDVSEVPSLLVELQHVLRSNRMDVLRPLSSSSYETWRNSLARKEEEVTTAMTPSGVTRLSLRTKSNDAVDTGRISEAVLVIRTPDWHPEELRLKVKTEDGVRDYEITESSFDVVNLPALDPAIFALPENTSQKISSAPKSAAVNKTQVPLYVSVPSAPVHATASLDIEMEALRLLHEAGADLGEQVTVERAADGVLMVQGIVQTDERKSQILSALRDVERKPGVRINIKTVSEALADLRNKPVEPRISSEHEINVTNNAIAAQSELRTYFSGKGEDSDAAIRDYTARVVSRSRQAMRRLYAIKRLVNQFSQEQLSTLTPEARSKWLVMIKGHARRFESEVSQLRNELQPVFFASFPSTEIPSGPAIIDDSGLVTAIERLFEIGAANDSLIRSAFTASAENVRISAIKNPQFLQSLKTSEALASRIQSAR